MEGTDTYSPDSYWDLLYEIYEIEDKIKLKKNHDDIVECIWEISEFIIWSERQNGSYFE